jgi:hypothetical protein
MAHATYRKPGSDALTGSMVRARGGVLSSYAMRLHSGPVAEGRKRRPTAVWPVPLNGAGYDAQQQASVALRGGMTQARADTLSYWRGTGACSTLFRTRFCPATIPCLA